VTKQPKESTVFKQLIRKLICEKGKGLYRGKDYLAIRFKEDGKWTIDEEYKGDGVDKRFDAYIIAKFGLTI
jgi:hypothetical protein